MIKVQCEYTIVGGAIKGLKANKLTDPSSTSFENIAADYILALFNEVSKNMDTPQKDVNNILNSIGNDATNS